MSESRLSRTEYGYIPESPATREFVYNQLLDFFGIDEESPVQPGGKRRGFIHTAKIQHLENFLAHRLEIHNETSDVKIYLARTAIPKTIQELTMLDIAGGSYTYERIAYYESRRFPEGYREEHAKQVFPYS